MEHRSARGISANACKPPRTPVCSRYLPQDLEDGGFFMKLVRHREAIDEADAQAMI